MPATYRVRVAAAAKADLREIFLYIANDRPASAEKIKQRLVHGLKSLRFFPERYSKIREKFHTKFIYRHVLIRPYRIVFRVFGNEVLVVRIVHQARLFKRAMLLEFE